MYQFKGLDDTIVAISTAMGPGGIGIIRVSGKDALAIVDKIFKAKSERCLKDVQTFTVHYGWIVSLESSGEKEEEILDEVLVSVMKSPHSYTTENIVEINCHGGMVSVQEVFHEVVTAGARPAEPGEFTKRAFLNGRIDLTQAEAVLDIIQSKTQSFLKVSTQQLKGDLSKELTEIRAELINTYVALEAFVNFPEDGIEDESRKGFLKTLEEAKQRVDQLLKSSSQGRILKEGIKIVLCGKPNVGKSSLLNVFLKQPRAIVSHVAGTTRDTIEETAQINGIPFQVVDTAGILKPRDIVEEEAVKRSHSHIESADLLLLILDYSSPLSEEDLCLIEDVKDKNVVVVINKGDLSCGIDEKFVQDSFSKENVFVISVLQNENIEDLKKAIVKNVMHGDSLESHGVLVSNVRHIDALKKCLSLLGEGCEHLQKELSYEFISEDIKFSINQLDAITGRNIDADLLDTIFSQFCIGK